jgi:asparagine synthase (glutamine-hydrolysing)
MYLRRIAEEHREGIARHGDRLWLLINLEMWQRIFIDGEEPASIYANSSSTISDELENISTAAAA